MITRILASMIRIGLGLFWRIVTCSLDREIEESGEEAGEAEDRPENSPSLPDENNADESAEFDVFLSFCEEDTRKVFTDNLHHNLMQRGVKAFIDSKNLPKGERIHLLHRYVQRSKVFLPVFSKGYADSEWCLREISTAVKCKKNILPVFFNIEPSDLKGGDGCFARCFQEHAGNKQLDQQEVKGWLDACKEAGSLHGFVLSNDMFYGHEADYIQVLVKDVMTRVRIHLLDVAKHPIILESRVEEIKGMLLEGIDKKTIKKVLCCEKVLALPDDVGHRNQLEALAGEVEESHEEAGEAEERTEDSPSSPEETNVDGSAEFEVFLSFHGKDTRKGFTGHLHQNLMQRGVKAFIDSKNLPKGERVHLLHRYVQRSKVFLPVFSKGYANSTWCLRELSTAVKCKKKIIPVFFNVEPSDLKGGGGCFARSFQEHAKNEKLDQQEVKGWVDACKEAGSISGYHLQNDAAGYEAKFIQMIVKDVMTCVGTKALLDVVKHPVGLKPRVEEIKGMLGLQDLEGSGVVMIGIHGMGGIGKTTLAKAVYNEIARNFEACSFLLDVRETFKTQGLRSLQTRMIKNISEGKMNDTDGFTTQTLKSVASWKKVLVVLDDVDHRDQLEALVGDRHWFGKGSRIIITTRDKSVLKRHGMEEGNMYAIEELNQDDSMELFCYHAFRSKQPPDELYKRLAEEVVGTTGGLPLALEVLGSQFFDMKTPKEWEALITKLKKYQCKDVHDRLRISYDQLDDCEKEVFLDIACFFIGRGKEYPMLMWEDCEFYPSITIKVLLHKSLIKMTTRHHAWYFLEEKVEVFAMHDQIRDMGRNIVFQERGSLTHLFGRRSRFWNTMTTVIEELKTMEESRSVQGIDFYSRENIPANLLERHTQLRYLCGQRLTFQGNCLQLPAPMKWLSLRDCELDQMSSTSDFDPGKSIVILDLGLCSHLARDFVVQSFLGRPKGFEKLKVLDLRRTDITTTPDFSNLPCPNLEKMRLCSCQELTTVHQSIGQLKRLEILDLEGCTKLSSLPITLGGMTSLKKLMLKGCKNLSSLPNTLGALTSLEELLLDKMRIETLPDSIGDLTNLRTLSLRGCARLEVLPHSFRKLCSLKSLPINGTRLKDLTDYNYMWDLMEVDKLSLQSFEILYVLPDHLLCEKLRHLRLADPTVEALPESMGQWGNLRKLSVKCKKLKSLPESISSLQYLEKLELSNCDNLSSLPLLPASLSKLNIVDCIKVETICIYHSKSLIQINLHACSTLMGKGVSGTGNNTDIMGCAFAEQSSTRGKELNHLKVLDLSQTGITATLDFNNLQCPGLEKLILRNCTQLKMVHESVTELRGLLLLDLRGCHQLSSLPNTLGGMTSLEKLVLDCSSVETIPDSIATLTNLRKLFLTCYNPSPYSNKLSSLPRLPPSLVELKIIGCIPNVETMASISHLTSLTTLWLCGCSSLKDVPGLENIVNNLEDLMLPLPSIERSLWCDNLNVHFRKTIFQEATFDAVCMFGWAGRIYFVTPGAGGQLRLDFMLPRHIPFTSFQDVTGELSFDGVLLNVNEDGEACWDAHVEVVDDDDLTIVHSMAYALLPEQPIMFWDAETNRLVTQAMDLGRSCIIRVSLELPQEPVTLFAFLKFYFFKTERLQTNFQTVMSQIRLQMEGLPRLSDMEGLP